MQSEVVNLHILGGVKQGIISARVPNWSGKVYTVPIGKIGLLDDEVNSGVYIIIDGNKIRIGWAINWLNNETLSERVKKEEDTTTGGKVILLTTTDEYFLEPKTVVALVNKLAQGMSASKYEVETNAQKVVVETDVDSQVDSFIRKVKVVLRAQGYGLFDETEVDTQPEMPNVDEDSRTQLVGKTEEASKNEEVNVEAQKKEGTTDVYELLQELEKDYSAKIYIYGDLLRLENRLVAAKGRLFKDKFILLGGSIIKNKVGRGPGFDHISGKLLKDETFNTMDEALKFLQGEGGTITGEWCSVNGEPITNMVKVELPEGTRVAWYRNDGEGVDAEGYLLPNNYFILKEGSIISSWDNTNLGTTDKVKNFDFVQGNRHKVDKDTNITTGHIVFKTISGAAAFVSLRIKNGWVTWVDEDGNNFDKGL